MKTPIKLMLTAALLSVGLASTASAQYTIYLTGSSAYRAAVTNSIVRLLTNPGTSTVAPTFPLAAYDGSSLAGSTHQAITGTLNTTATVTGGSGTMPAGSTVTVFTCWTGSLSGLSSLNGSAGVSPSFASFYLTGTDGATAAAPGTGVDSSHGIGTGYVGANGTTYTFSGHPTTDSVSTTSINPTGAFSDVYASSTSFNNSAFVEANGTKVLGVVPFLFVGSPDLKNYVTAAGGQVTNIQATQAKQLLGGSIDMAQLTGNDADDANTPCNVLAVGRNADSGTRFVTFAETGFNPIGGIKQPIQYQVNFTTSGSGATAVNSVSTAGVVEYPADTTFPGSVANPTPLGNSGYPSGGNESSALQVPGTSTYTTTGNQANGYMIGYLGESDAKTAVSNANPANNAYFLSYNGSSYGTVTYTTSGAGVAASVSFLGTNGRTQLEEGLYTLWGYEHEYYLNTTAAAPRAFLDALGSQVKVTDATIAGDKTANMAVERGSEGAAISYVGIGQSSK